MKRVKGPNDPKLSDSGGRRGSCAAGLRGAGAVTPGAVRCSAWLGVAAVDKIGDVWKIHSALHEGARQRKKTMFKSIGIVCGGIAFGLPVLAVVGAGVALVGVGAGIGYVVGGAKLAAVVGAAVAAV